MRFFEKNKIAVTCFSHPDYHERRSASFEEAFKATLSSERESVDFAFSFNYFPVFAHCCHEHGIKYISVVYDDPQTKLFSYTITHPTNFVFHFDSETVDTFRKGGISTIYYAPLPTDPALYGEKLLLDVDKDRVSADVSFVGALYNEGHNFYDRLTGISDYTRGYLEAIMAAQSKVYGYSFLEQMLNKDIMEDVKKDFPYTPEFDSIETLEYVFRAYCLERKLTSIERIDLLTKAASRFDLKIFTHPGGNPIAGAKMMGITDYHTEMPSVFNHSRINLNITLRSIHTGIPMRCMDIMACGGFVLTNFQADYLKHFEAGKDFAFFESPDDMVSKIDYYLSHESQRAEIAANGLEKIKEYYTFDALLPQMMDIAGL